MSSALYKHMLCCFALQHQFIRSVHGYARLRRRRNKLLSAFDRRAPAHAAACGYLPRHGYKPAGQVLAAHMASIAIAAVVVWNVIMSQSFFSLIVQAPSPRVQPHPRPLRYYSRRS